MRDKGVPQVPHPEHRQRSGRYCSPELDGSAQGGPEWKARSTYDDDAHKAPFLGEAVSPENHLSDHHAKEHKIDEHAAVSCA